MAAILEFDMAVAQAVRSALGDSATVLSDASQVVSHVVEHNDPLVIIGASVDAEVARRLTEQVASAHPAAGVIWLRRRVDTTTVLEAIRAGASDVVGESDLPALIAASQRVISRASAFAASSGAPLNSTRGQVTAIYSPKGGSGKTSIATNLAALVAREMRQRVGILDLDLESGDVQLLMSLPHGRSIVDLTNLGNSLDTSALASAMIAHPSGAYVLAAPRRPEEASVIKPELVARIVDQAAMMFDQVIIDCPPYTTEHVLTVMDVADHIAMICTPDAASVKNTALSLELLTELNFISRVSLIINHAGDKVGITTADIAHALDFPVICEIPSSLEMPLATNSGRILSMSHPQHPIPSAIRSWATRLAPPEPVRAATVPAQVEAVKAPRRSLFGFKRVATI